MCAEGENEVTNNMNALVFLGPEKMVLEEVSTPSCPPGGYSLEGRGLWVVWVFPFIRVLPVPGCF